MNLIEQIRQNAFEDEIKKVAGVNFANLAKKFKSSMGTATKLNEIKLPGGQGVMRPAPVVRNVNPYYKPLKTPVTLAGGQGTMR
jgi:cytochrome c551/c552